MTTNQRVNGHQSKDRSGISAPRLWLLAVLLTAQLRVTFAVLPINESLLDSRAGGVGIFTAASFLCAVMAVFALRSIPLRRIVWSFTILSGLAIARFGELSAAGGLTGSWKPLTWLGLSGALLALSPESRSMIVAVPRVVLSRRDVPDHVRSGVGHAGSRRSPHRSSSWSVPLTVIISAVLLLGSVSLLLGPFLGQHFPAGTSVGDVLDRGQDQPQNVMAARTSLDMTTRPNLTNEVVMSVRSPLALFWRTETFDLWNGTRWTRSRGAAGDWIVDGRAPQAPPDDIAAVRGEPSTQHFRIESKFASAIPSAASPVRVDSATQLAQRIDGTIVAPLRPLGSGATYTVESRQMPVDTRLLAATGSATDSKWDDDETVQAVLGQYARTSAVTERVAALARQIVHGRDSDFSKAQAIERWLSTNTTYSTKAPLARPGVDVVDDFLFESKVGWCEQIASAFVVMARVAGVPARIVTGFVPGKWDPVGGRFIVRESDAHAWAEVWFPDLGWVPFDPTSSVPFAGSQDAKAPAAASDWRVKAGLALLLVVAVVWSMGPIWRVATRMAKRLWAWIIGRRHVRGHRSDPVLRLERIGARLGRSRLRHETLTAYGGQLAQVASEPDLTGVGAALDRISYSAPADTSTHTVVLEEVDRVLDAFEARH